MPDYKRMYHILFREMTKTISALQKAQQQTEELYIADDTTNNLIVIKSGNETDGNDKGKQPLQG